MFAVLTVGNMYYDEPLFTFPSHADAWKWAHATLHGDWFDIQRVF